MTVRLMKVLVVLAAVSASASGEDWPQFLGPDRTGVTQEAGLLTDWPEDGPHELWRADCVGGLSGIAVAGDLVLTMAQDDDNQVVVAFAAATGRPVWRTAVAPAYRNAMGNGPRATPAFSAGRVYAYTGDGVLVALDAKTGAVRWSREIVAESGGKPAEYGMASSPLVYGGLVIVTAGTPGALVVACDADTGEIRWRSGEDRPGYSSPVIATLAGSPRLLVFGGSGLHAVDPASGRQVWTYSFATDYDCNTANPVVIGDDVIISAGENHGTVRLHITDDGPTEVWTSLGKDSVLRAEWQTPVRVGQHLFGLDNAGSAGPITNLTCIDAQTGRRVWQQRRFGKANAILAGNRLWLTTMKGELVLVEASPEKFTELGRRKYVGMTRQAPSIAGGRLYLRDERQIVALDIAADTKGAAGVKDEQEVR